MRFLRRGHVLSVCHLHGCDAEVVNILQIRVQRLRLNACATSGDLESFRLERSVEMESGSLPVDI